MRCCGDDGALRAAPPCALGIRYASCPGHGHGHEYHSCRKGASKVSGGRREDKGTGEREKEWGYTTVFVVSHYFDAAGPDLARKE